MSRGSLSGSTIGQDFLNGIAAGLRESDDPGTRAFGSGIAGGMQFGNERRSRMLEVEQRGKVLDQLLERAPEQLRIRIEEARQLGRVDADLRIELERVLGDMDTARAAERAIIERREDVARARELSDVAVESERKRRRMHREEDKSDAEYDRRNFRSADLSGIAAGLKQTPTRTARRPSASEPLLGGLASRFSSFGRAATDPLGSIAAALRKGAMQ
jgi:hypothetical protein